MVLSNQSIDQLNGIDRRTFCSPSSVLWSGTNRRTCSSRPILSMASIWNIVVVVGCLNVKGRQRWMRNTWIHGVARMLPFIGFGKGGGKSTGEAQLLLQLATVLRGKGVPQDRVEERAALGLRKIGYQEIEAALRSANPWTYLKAIASRPHVSFQWIHADELQSKIRAKASAKFQIQAKAGKKHPKPAGETKPLWIDPNMLQLVPGTFYAQDKEIGQIQFSDVTSSASGLAFCAIADVMPFLKAGTTLSDKPLAVITTTPIPADHGSALVVNHLRFPAQFRGTNEPVLLQGSIVMLGPVPITRGNGGTQCVLEHLPTQTLRLCVFRDQWEVRFHFAASSCRFATAPASHLV